MDNLLLTHWPNFRVADLIAIHPDNVKIFQTVIESEIEHYIQFQLENKTITVWQSTQPDEYERAVYCKQNNNTYIVHNGYKPKSIVIPYYDIPSSLGYVYILN